VKVFEKAQKILELVERGEDGEATAAKSLLDKLLEKNALSVAQVKHYRELMQTRPDCARRKKRPAPPKPNKTRPVHIFTGYGFSYSNGGFGSIFSGGYGWGPGNTSTASGTSSPWTV
jgi:hypothetical protein